MQEPDSIEKSLSRQVKSAIVLVLLLLVVVFTLQNTESIVVVFLWMQFTLPRALILFVFLVIGFLAGLAVCNWKILSGRAKISGP